MDDDSTLAKCIRACEFEQVSIILKSTINEGNKLKYKN